MKRIFILLLVLTLLILAMVLYLLYLSKEKSSEKILKFLDKLIWVIFGFAAITIIFSAISGMLVKDDSPIIIVQIIKLIFEGVLFVLIAIELRFLVSQLKKLIIFEKSNAASVFKIGKSFILLTSIEIITGLLIATFYFITSTNNKSFTLSLNLQTFIYITIGLIFYVISFIYHKAIDIYEENQLTI